MKRRIYNINNKILVETSDLNLLNENEIAVNKPTVYRINIKGGFKNGYYHNTASFPENVKFEVKKDVEINNFFYKGNVGTFTPIIDSIIPKGTGVIIKSKNPVTLEFFSTHEKPKFPIIGNLVGFYDDYTPDDVRNIIDDNKIECYALGLIDDNLQFYVVTHDTLIPQGKGICVAPKNEIKQKTYTANNENQLKQSEYEINTGQIL